MKITKEENRGHRRRGRKEEGARRKVSKGTGEGDGGGAGARMGQSLVEVEQEWWWWQWSGGSSCGSWGKKAGEGWCVDGGDGIGGMVCWG